MELGGDDRNEGQEGETRQTQGTKEEHRKDNRKSKLLSKVIKKKRKPPKVTTWGVVSTRH